MGIVIKANFRTKLTPKLARYKPKDNSSVYQKEIFTELFSKFPQFKAHVSGYVERNYCGVVVNDEDHSDPETLINMLKFDEIQTLNRWIVDRNGPRVIQQK
jgi:antibiotic biosynthesis monooxygenase (ABM) superfamily enzyme